MVNNGGVPPPPPPPPGGFRNGGPGPGPGPGPQAQPQHYSHTQFQTQNSHSGNFQPSQLPIRTQSHRVSNVITGGSMDDATALKELTSYKVFTLRKAISTEPRQQPSWGSAGVIEESLAQGDIIRAIGRLNQGDDHSKHDKGSKRERGVEKGYKSGTCRSVLITNKSKSDKHDNHDKKSKPKTITEKMLNLAPYQSAQIAKIRDELTTNDRDPRYEWTVAQIESRYTQRAGVKQTDVMIVYFKRAPVAGTNVMLLRKDKIEQEVQRERDKQIQYERRVREQQMRDQQIRDHQLREQQLRNQQAQQQHNNGGPQIITLSSKDHKGDHSRDHGRKKSGSKSRSSKEHRRSNKKYDSDSSSLYDSDTSYFTEDSDSLDTSVSSSTRQSDKHHRKDKHAGKRAIRSHRKYYHEDDRLPKSPRTIMQEQYVPPQVPAAPLRPQYDKIEAAYQAGLQDADADHYALEQIRSERQVMGIERQGVYTHVPRSLPPFQEEAIPVRRIRESRVPLDRSLPRRLSETVPPRGIVSYSAEQEPPRPSLSHRIYSDSPRYVDDSYRGEERLRQQQRFANQHIDGRGAAERSASFHQRPVIHQERVYSRRNDHYYD